jgi:hypothetical protein
VTGTRRRGSGRGSAPSGSAGATGRRPGKAGQLLSCRRCW